MASRSCRATELYSSQSVLRVARACGAAAQPPCPRDAVHARPTDRLKVFVRRRRPSRLPLSRLDPIRRRRGVRPGGTRETGPAFPATEVSGRTQAFLGAGRSPRPRACFLQLDAIMVVDELFLLVLLLLQRHELAEGAPTDRAGPRAQAAPDPCGSVDPPSSLQRSPRHAAVRPLCCLGPNSRL